MNKQNISLTIQKNMTQIPATGQLTAMLPGCLLLTGFWGTLLQELQIPGSGFFLLIPATVALLLGLVLRWDKRWQVWTAIGALAAACVGCVLLGSSLRSGIAALWARIGYWHFVRTGYYAPGFEGTGNPWPVLCLVSALSGFLTAWLLRMKNPLLQVLLAVALLMGWAAGLLTSGWWIALYLTGTLLAVAAYASGHGKALTLSGTIALVLAAVIGLSFLLTGFMPHTTNLGADLRKKLHSLRWEEAGNPLPEGRLQALGPYQPAGVPALEVTMDQWTPLYLRGFVAGRYTDSGWEPLEAETLAAGAEDLYALQAGYFLPGTQLYAASRETDANAENTVTVKNIGACRAYTYLPYGAGDIEGTVLTPEDLRWEGTHAPQDRQYTARLYGIEESYLLQAELKDATDTPYRTAEGAYRDWVYANYVTIPQQTQELLSTYLTTQEQITTVQAKRQIVRLLDEAVTYEETVLTDAGQRDFLSYTLEVSRSGYSVHYATLAVLMLRYYGIPARYVEGYVITPGQAEALSSGETLTLTDANAHAWAEYYLDGVGWLPFDATPGYTDILTFTLPDEGLPTEEESSTDQKQEEPQEAPIKEPRVEEAQTEGDSRLYVRQAIGKLPYLLLLLLGLMLLRTGILRSRLRKRQKSFLHSDGRRACAGILCYIQVIVTAMGKNTQARSVPEIAKTVSVALDGQVDEAALEQMLNEVWYSDHPISPAHTAQAQAWLEIARERWKRKVPAPKRFAQKYITCKIL